MKHFLLIFHDFSFLVCHTVPRSFFRHFSVFFFKTTWTNQHFIVFTCKWNINRNSIKVLRNWHYQNWLCVLVNRTKNCQSLYTTVSTRWLRLNLSVEHKHLQNTSGPTSKMHKFRWIDTHEIWWVGKKSASLLYADGQIV